MEWTKDKDAVHYVNKNRLLPPFPEGMQLAMFGNQYVLFSLVSGSVYAYVVNSIYVCTKFVTSKCYS